MLKYPVDPEVCLIVNAFNKASTLRAAAFLLGVDAPGLVRKVRRISEEHGYLQKLGNRWVITDAGRKVAQWTDEVISSQRILLETKQQHRIASFTWLAEEMLIPNFPALQESFGKGFAWSFHITSAHLEQELIRGRTDFVIQGHAPTDPSIAYKKVSSLPWIVILPASWQKDVGRKTGAELRGFLNQRPFVRHEEVNPSEAVGFKVDMISDLVVDGVIGVRSAVASGAGWSLVPRMAAQTLLRQKRVMRADLATPMRDELSVWWLRARKDIAKGAPAVCRWAGSFSVE